MSISILKAHLELPIFLLSAGEHSVFYTPGHACLAVQKPGNSVQALSANGELADGLAAVPAPAGLIAAARRARDSWDERAREEFAPECLTIHLSNRCNLSCDYCYAAGTRNGGSAAIREEAVIAAAGLVARCCAARNNDFQLVIHGGGEPTVHFALVQRLVEKTRGIARQAGIAWNAHIATNGIVSDSEASWLARNFTSIGLSCDGPREIHDLFRRRPDGAGSSRRVEETAKAVADAGGRLMLRATIHPRTMSRQVEIVEYLVRQLGASDLRFEPVYQVRGAHGTRFEADQADDFVRHFLAAESRAASLGATLRFSGVRLDELHGPYCNVLRNVLQLNPDGSVSGCFALTDAGSTDGRRAVIGRYDEVSNRIVLKREKIQRLRQRAATIPARCQSCLCAYHCVRECPESCTGLDEPGTGPAGGFRCRIARRLAETWILQAASNHSGKDIPVPGIDTRLSRSGGSRSRLPGLLTEVPSGIDRDLIMEEWSRVCRHFRLESCELPKPTWAERGYEHDDTAAWAILRSEIEARQALEPFSIYLHLPFCGRRCHFCDCYSVVSNSHGASGVEARFTRTLLEEIDAWAGTPALAGRPVTTVHFGGGTPNHLAQPMFAAIVDTCRGRFAAANAAEWALESTNRLLDDAHLRWLRQLGFTRLHSGVQTLEEAVRTLIGRQDPPARVVERLERAIKDGFILSVDIVYGLPGQTATGLTTTIRQLVDIGVHGFSLYRFQRTLRNRKLWARQADPAGDRMREYVLFHCAEQMLASSGYRKNHFTHFARPEDGNLYYRHALRGEDLLALGPTADGIFGTYLYRHPELEAYLGAGETSRPALEGGLRETDAEQRLRPLTSSLMAAEINGRLLDWAESAGLLGLWQEACLIRRDSTTGTWTLAANGSVFISEMLKQIKMAARSGIECRQGPNRACGAEYPGFQANPFAGGKR